MMDTMIVNRRTLIIGMAVGKRVFDQKMWRKVEKQEILRIV